MESSEKELTVLDCKTWPMLEMYCPLVMFLGVFGCLFIYS